MKALKSTVLMIMILPLFLIAVSAADADDGFQEEYDSFGVNGLYEELDETVKDALSSIGIDGVGFSGINSVSPADIFSLIKEQISGGYKDILKKATELCGVVFLCSVVTIFVPDSKKTNRLINITGILLCVTVLSVPVMNAFRSAAAAIEVCCTFVKTLIPVMAGIIIASGSPAGAASFQAFAFAAAQFISSCASGFAVPMISAVVSLDLAGSLLPEYGLDELSSFIKKSLISVTSGVSALYVAFLGIKDLLNDAVDSVSVKGVKLLINSAVPVIGAPLSELYGSLRGTASLIKSASGVFAIIAVCVTVLPPLINMLMWIFTLKALCSVCGVLMQEELSKLFRSLSSALVLMNVITLLSAAIFIVSIALILNPGG